MFYLKNNDRKRELGLFDVFNNMFSKEMKTNIEQTDKEYLVYAELPGVDKKNININIENNTLTITVNDCCEKEDNNRNYLIKERTSACVSRSFYLESMDENSVKAKLDNGILSIIIKKQENKIDPKKIINID